LQAGLNAARRAVLRLLTLAFLSLGALPASAQSSPDAASYYRLLPGDEISVRLPLNPELDTTGPIGPDGRFSIPLAGRVEIGGMTLGDAEGAISRALRDGKIVADARPGIVVAKYAGVVYVGGEVRDPGPVPLTKALNPLQAIINAGGLLNTARSKKVVIVRQVTDTAHRIETVDIRDIVKTGGFGAPLALAPGDVVFVPKSTIAEVDLFIDQYINRIVPNALHFNVNVGNGNATTTTISP
jgi:protein involved in polysaccharide export with SLBB domain